MAEENKELGVSVLEAEGEPEVKDRGLFDFVGKKHAEEKSPEVEEDSLTAGVQNIHIEEGYKSPVDKEKEGEKQHEKADKEEEKHHGLLDKLHRSHSSSSSSSSSDEEEVEGEGGIKEKIKKKKTVKEKIEGKSHGGEEHHGEEKKPGLAPPQHVEELKVQLEEVELEPVAPEKKGFLDKFKEKLPGHSKKSADEGVKVLPPDTVESTGEHAKVQDGAEGPGGKEKKGIIEKIIEKLPGYHKSAGEEGDKSPANH